MTIEYTSPMCKMSLDSDDEKKVRVKGNFRRFINQSEGGKSEASRTNEYILSCIEVIPTEYHVRLGCVKTVIREAVLRLLRTTLGTVWYYVRTYSSSL